MSVGGAASNAAHGAAANNALKAAYGEEARKRRQLENKSAGVFNRNLASFSPVGMRGAETTRTNAYQQATTPTTARSFSPVEGATPAAQRAIAGKVASVNAESARTATGRGGLEGMGDFLLNQNLEQRRGGDEIATNNDFIRGNQGVLNLEIGAADAQRKDPLGDALMAAGQIIGAAGSVAGAANGPPKNILPGGAAPIYSVPPAGSFSPISLGPLY